MLFSKNDDDLFPKCDTLSIGVQTAKKGTREKETQYKDATISNKFTQTVNMFTYNTISEQTMPHPILIILVWNQGKRTILGNQALREQN